MSAILDEILKAPQLRLYYEHIHAVLAAEAQRREEFYNTITEDDKAEFINGEVVFHSPVTLRHSNAVGNLLMLLDTFASQHTLGYVGYSRLLISLTRNDYQPDICFFGTEKARHFFPDQDRFPAPDLAVEVLSPSTASNDRGIKFEDYAAHGVTEYWIIDPANEIVEQYVLDDAAYSLRMKAGTGEIASVVVPGFGIPIRAIFDEAENLATQQRLLADERGNG